MKIKLYSETLGREVEVPETPKRIVSLSPAITETLYLLGLEDRIAGVSVFCHKPPEARKKPKVGSYYKVDYKKLEELKPDLILTTTGAQLKVVRELEEKGYTVYPIPLPITVYGILDEIVTIGIVTGEIPKARKLAAELNMKLSKLYKTLNGVKAYYEIFLGGPVSAGAHSYIADAFDYLGVETPFTHHREPWVINPDPQRIIEFDPQIIIYEQSPYIETTIEKIKREMTERGLENLKPLREDKIIILPPDTLAHYGPSLIDSLQMLTHRIKQTLQKDT
ncbi:MAG: ABC transporter substrate-binding protein [Desulfurococcales archaeon]|nr:ABC transporter substrate-binding protein [Desulfurococcales archaeon]